jgi:hypothetical protein
MKKMSKFDYAVFSGGDEDFAVNSDKYTKEEAIALACQEVGYTHIEYTLLLDNMFVRHRAGLDEDNKPTVGWWLESFKYKRSCPVYAFRAIKYEPSPYDRKHYECIKMNAKEADK